MSSLKYKIKKLIGRGPKYGFFGFYASWQDAQKASSGWQAVNVLEKVSAALEKVKNGEAVYERDSVLFDKIQYSWPLLALLLRVANENGGVLRVADFGGSLGTTYFQNREFLAGLKKIEWNIIEQENYVRRGNELFKNDILNFFASIDEMLKSKTKPDVLLVSSIIQYLEKPFEMVSKFIAADFDYIVFDRTSFISAPEHRIAIQKVKPSLYEAAFPIWFFNYAKFLNPFLEKYQLIAEFPAFIASEYQISGIRGGDRGFILSRKQ